MRTQQLGNAAEQAALDFLVARDLKLVDRNYSCRLGEIDLIMRDPQTLVFVEVRLRNHPAFGTGAETVTRSKIKKILNTAQNFLMRYPSFGELDSRFDVISIGREIDWIKNAFGVDY